MTPDVPFYLIPYLIGSIPFGLIIPKLLGYGDIRKIGSGNVGATNVLRTGNKPMALAVLLLDAAKGAFLIIYLMGLHNFTIPNFSAPDPLFAPNLGHFLSLLIGLFAVFGHCFPIWLKFKGGKGVATALGVLLAAVPIVGFAACATWLIAAKITKISSLSALIAFAIAPIVTLLIYGSSPAAICFLISALVWVRHKANISRILKGEEPKIGANKKERDAEPVSK